MVIITSAMAPCALRLRRQRALATDDDLRPLYFRLRLGGVTPVGKEQTLGMGQYQGARAAAESAKIEDVGQASHHQRIQTIRRESVLQTQLASLVIHTGIAPNLIAHSLSHGRSLAIGEDIGHAGEY